MRKLLGGVAAAAAIGAISASGPQARADLLIEASVNGGAFAPIVDSVNPAGPVSFTGSLGDFGALNLSAFSNSPGTSSLSKLVSATLSLTNNGSSTENIVLAISATGFTLPITPPDILLNSHIGGSVVIDNPANLLSFTSCIVEGSSNVDSCAGATATAGPGTPSITSGSFNDDKFANISTLTAPYTVVEILSLTLGSGSEVNFAANSTLAPVPEPASLAIFGTALAGLGFLSRRRRRNS